MRSSFHFLFVLAGLSTERSHTGDTFGPIELAHFCGKAATGPREASWTAAALCRFGFVCARWESGRGLPQSKSPAKWMALEIPHGLRGFLTTDYTDCADSLTRVIRVIRG